MIREAIEYKLYSAIISTVHEKKKRDTVRHWLVKED